MSFAVSALIITSLLWSSIFVPDNVGKSYKHFCHI